MRWKALLGSSVALLGIAGIAILRSWEVREDLRWALWSMIHQPSADSEWEQN